LEAFEDSIFSFEPLTITLMQQSIGGVLGEGNRGCGGKIKGDTNQFSFVYVFTRSTHSTEAHGGLMEFTGVSW
jgi:hypothetical protein